MSKSGDMRKTRHNPFSLFCASFFIAMLGFIMLGAVSKDAHALRVTMKRVIFEGPKRTEVLTIINNTTEEQVYRLGWRRMRMTEDNSLQALDEEDSGDDLREAAPMIRYAPRRVVLPPGRTQQVRLMLRRPRDLQDGEYRSHFWVQPEEQATAFNPDADQQTTTGQAIQITMLTGLTLPVFVRAGEMTVSGRIDNARVVTEGDRPVVRYTLHREGNRSLYGDVEVTCRAGGQEIVATSVRGIAVYTEVDKRQVTHALRSLPQGGCTNMKITYTATSDDPFYKGELIAEAPVSQ